MKWSFSYGLKLDGKSIPLDTTLRQAGAKIGSVVQIRINGTYEDLYENELKEAFAPDKVYLESLERRRRKEWLREQVNGRRFLTREKLKAIADSCFAHV